jgi:fucose 4-O-acetylase-like acetyltransferase
MGNTREKDHRIDTIKGLLIILVVLGHIIGICGYGVICENIWQIIYVFHMPLFILISGYLTTIKPISVFWKSLNRIVVPLLIFQLLFVFIAVVIFRNAFSISYLITPFWILWYLLSLAFWRIMIQFTPKILLSLPLLYLIIATVIAIFGGLMPYGRILSIQRTFSFYPFFLFGFYLTILSYYFI